MKINQQSTTDVIVIYHISPQTNPPSAELDLSDAWTMALVDWQNTSYFKTLNQILLFQ